MALVVERDCLKLSDSDLSPEKIIVKNSGLAIHQRIKDPDGDLIISQMGLDLPPEYFTRIYRRDMMNPDSKIGHHAHKNTEQYVFSASGSFILHLDDGERQQNILMDEHHIGVKLGRRLWHLMSDYEPNSVMLVYANTFYDESDYIRNYEDFLAYIKK